MKRLFGILSLFILFSATCVSYETTEAVEFCVDNEAGMRHALAAAAGNGEHDVIRLVQGNYVGTFRYSPNGGDPAGLSIEGGYTAGCKSRLVNPSNTILDGNFSGTVLDLTAPYSVTNLKIDGITVRNGVAGNGNGGGILARGSDFSITVTDCIIHDNSAQFMGGGIHIDNADSAKFVRNIVYGNTVSGFFSNGGGIYVNSCNTTFLYNKIRNNAAAGILGNGGGVRVSSCTLTFSNNTVSGNSARGSGGGIYANWTESESDRAVFSKNRIFDNSANASGGGVSVLNADTIIFTGNIIEKNAAWDNGGGVNTEDGDFATFTNNIICDNLVLNPQGSGGGVYVGMISSLSMTNNTITRNSAVHGNGGGLFVQVFYTEDTATLLNNIIWNNTAGENGFDLYMDNDGNGNSRPGTVNLLHNDLDAGNTGIFIKIPRPVDPSNLDDVDPLFDDDDNCAYHLSSTSPCIDAGRLEGAPDADIDAEPRPYGGGVDIGADEYNPRPLPPHIAVETDNSTVTVSWSPVKRAGGYTLYYAPYPDAPYAGTIDLGNVTSISGNLWTGAAFYVAVLAYNSEGNGDLSNIEFFVIP